MKLRLMAMTLVSAGVLAATAALATAAPVQLEPRIMLSPGQLARLQAIADEGPEALRRYLWRTRAIYNYAFADLVSVAPAAPARGPPRWDAVDAALIDATPFRDPFAPPEPAYAFDQRIAW